MHENDIFIRTIIVWYDSNKRDLPWRHTKDPYKIWLSEIILQQTRVDQGLPYYLHFTETYPTIKDLALASEDQVMKSWEGLGYYSRARNLLSTAQEIHFKKADIFPKTAAELIKLKGIGDYTSAAIASFAYEEAIPVVDGNVFRLVSRYFGLSDDISKVKTKSVFKELLQPMINKAKPSVFNNAIMEFGAQYCKSKSPNCLNCCLKLECNAYQNDLVKSLPFNSKKIRKKIIHLHYFIHDGGFQWIKKRDSSGIWPSLYETPICEESMLIDGGERNAYVDIHDCQLLKETTHQLTHRTLKLKFWQMNLSNSEYSKSSDYIAVNNDQLNCYSFPKVFHWIYSYF